MTVEQLLCTQHRTDPFQDCCAVPCCIRFVWAIRLKKPLKVRFSCLFLRRRWKPTRRHLETSKGSDFSRRSQAHSKIEGLHDIVKFCCHTFRTRISESVLGTYLCVLRSEGCFSRLLQGRIGSGSRWQWHPWMTRCKRERERERAGGLRTPPMPSRREREREREIL